MLGVVLLALVTLGSQTLISRPSASLSRMVVLPPWSVCEVGRFHAGSNVLLVYSAVEESPGVAGGPVALVAVGRPVAGV